MRITTLAGRCTTHGQRLPVMQPKFTFHFIPSAEMPNATKINVMCN